MLVLILSEQSIIKLCPTCDFSSSFGKPEMDHHVTQYIVKMFITYNY